MTPKQEAKMQRLRDKLRDTETENRTLRVRVKKAEDMWLYYKNVWVSDTTALADLRKKIKELIE